MRALPPALAAGLEAGATTLARCWRLVRADGLVLAVTEHDRDLTHAGVTYRAALAMTTGDVETDATAAPDRAALEGALAVDGVDEDDLALGRWTGARAELKLVDWRDPTLAVPVWSGRVGATTRRGAAFQLDLEGPEAALSRRIGRTIQRGCDAALGDARCRADLARPDRRGVTQILARLSDRAVRVAALPTLDPARLLDGEARLLSGRALDWRTRLAAVEAEAQGWLLTFDPPLSGSACGGRRAGADGGM
jgi:uncharacterized phage protein (TIGR02218 family)